MRYNSFAIVGPTGSGKTAIALRLAETHNGALICCDTTQLYAGLTIGTGAPTRAQSKGTPTYLYGTFRPNTPPPSATEYIRLAENCRRDALSRGYIPIFEGGNALLARLLLTDPPAPEHGPICVFRLSPRNADVQAEEKRLAHMLEEGLLEELSQLEREGSADSAAAQRSITHRAFTQYVRNQCTLTEATNNALHECRRVYRAQRRSFRRIPGTPYDLDISAPEHSFNAIEAAFIENLVRDPNPQNL